MFSGCVFQDTSGVGKALGKINGRHRIETVFRMAAKIMPDFFPAREGIKNHKGVAPPGIPGKAVPHKHASERQEKTGENPGSEENAPRKSLSIFGQKKKSYGRGEGDAHKSHDAAELIVARRGDTHINAKRQSQAEGAEQHDQHNFQIQRQIERKPGECRADAERDHKGQQEEEAVRKVKTYLFRQEAEFLAEPDKGRIARLHIFFFTACSK